MTDLTIVEKITARRGRRGEPSVLLAAAACLEEQAATALALATELEAQALELRALASSTPLPVARPASEREAREDPPVSREQLVFDLIVREGDRSSPEIADELGLSETQVLYALRALRGQGQIKRIGWARGVRWTLVSDPRAESSHDDDVEAIVRDWARQTTDEFRVEDLMATIPLHRDAARRYLGKLVGRGVLGVRERGATKAYRERFYTYRRPPKRTVNRERRDPPEKTVVGKRPRRGTIAQAKTPRVRNKDVSDLLEAITAAGAEIVRGGSHWKVSINGMVIGTVPTSPSDHRSLKNARANLKRAGLAI